MYGDTNFVPIFVVPVMLILHGCLLLLRSFDITTYGWRDSAWWVVVVVSLIIAFLVRKIIFWSLYARLYAKYPNLRVDRDAV